jgi:hypothetical protein
MVNDWDSETVDVQHRTAGPGSPAHRQLRVRAPRCGDGILTIEPGDQSGALIAGNEVRGGGVDFWCHNYVAAAT